MPDTIRAGTILVRGGTVFPLGLWFASKPFLPDWRFVENLDGCGLERIIGEAGWNFFYLAGEITATVFGSHGPDKARRAVKRILGKRTLEKFNSLEVTRVTQGRFWGIPFTTAIAHPRHIQESVFLFRASRRARNSASTEYYFHSGQEFATATECARGSTDARPDPATMLNFVFSRGGSKCS